MAFFSYLCEGADDAALHDATEEDEVDVFGERACGQVFQVVQNLLHGWRDEKEHNIKNAAKENTRYKRANQCGTVNKWANSRSRIYLHKDKFLHQ